MGPFRFTASPCGASPRPPGRSIAATGGASATRGGQGTRPASPDAVGRPLRPDRAPGTRRQAPPNDGKKAVGRQKGSPETATTLAPQEALARDGSDPRRREMPGLPLSRGRESLRDANPTVALGSRKSAGPCTRLLPRDRSLREPGASRRRLAAAVGWQRACHTVGQGPLNHLPQRPEAVVNTDLDPLPELVSNAAAVFRK